MGALIEAADVSRVYETGGATRPALRGVSLEVDEGELLAVMGRSGSGKSTLLNVLGGIDRSHSGQVRLAGVELGSCSDDELATLRRRSVGFVFQSFNLVPVLTALENVALPGIIDGCGERVCERRARALLDRFGLADRADQRPGELSGGEQQRVAIARSLFLEPTVLLADEPTGNLDSTSGAEVLDVLADTNEAMNQTIVLVTHDPVAAAVADRVIRLQDGVLVDELRFEPAELRSARRRRLVRWLEGPGGRPAVRLRGTPAVAR